MNRQERQERIAVLTPMLEAWEATKTEEGFDWDAAKAIEGLDLPEAEAERVKHVNGLYEEHKGLVEAENEAVKSDAAAAEEAEAAKAALREQTLSTLEPAPNAVHIDTRKAGGRQEFDLEKAFDRVMGGEKGVPLPAEMFMRRKSRFRTLGSVLGQGTEYFEREKADLDFPSQFMPAENAPGTHFKPTLLDYLRTITTNQSAYPIRRANSANTANAAIRDESTGLAEAALHADIIANVLQIVGAWQPVDWHEKYTPGSMAWTMEELARATRAEVDKRCVQGTGNSVGFGDFTSNSTTVAHQGSVLSGLVTAAAALAERFGEWPDSINISPTSLARAQSEANTNSVYLAKRSPEMNTDMLWNMNVIVNNHGASSGTGNAATRHEWVFHSSQFAVALHSTGFAMETGLNASDFRRVKEGIRAYAAMQMIVRNTAALQRVVVTGTA